MNECMAGNRIKSLALPLGKGYGKITSQQHLVSFQTVFVSFLDMCKGIKPYLKLLMVAGLQKMGPVAPFGSDKKNFHSLLVLNNCLIVSHK